MKICRFKTLENRKRNKEFHREQSNIHTPLAVPIGRQIDTREPHIDAGEVSEGGGSRGEVWRLGAVGKRLLKGIVVR